MPKYKIVLCTYVLYEFIMYKYIYTMYDDDDVWKPRFLSTVISSEKKKKVITHLSYKYLKFLFTQFEIVLPTPQLI